MRVPPPRSAHLAVLAIALAAAAVVLVGPRRPVTAAMRSATVAAELEQMPRLASEPFIDLGESERLIRGAPYADSLPAIHAIQVAPDGALRAVDEIAPGNSSWSATKFRPDGSIAGRLHAAATGFPLPLGRDWVVIRREYREGAVTSPYARS